MKNILTLGGSNSTSSINKTFAVYVAGQLKEATVTVADLNDYELPLYSSDLEGKLGIPDAVHAFSALITEADGIVLSLAEHNGFTTVAFKNLFDWVSRIDQNVWKNKPTLLMSTSPGEGGGANVLRIMKDLMPHFGGKVVADFSLPSFYDNFSAEGVKEEMLKLDLEKTIELFEASLAHSN